MAATAESASRIDLTIRGMHCAGCVGAVEAALRKTPGVERASGESRNRVGHRLVV